MSAETVRQFLLSLGFHVDEPGVNQFARDMLKMTSAMSNRLMRGMAHVRWLSRLNDVLMLPVETLGSEVLQAISPGFASESMVWQPPQAAATEIPNRPNINRDSIAAHLNRIVASSLSFIRGAEHGRAGSTVAPTPMHQILRAYVPQMKQVLMKGGMAGEHIEQSGRRLMALALGYYSGRGGQDSPETVPQTLLASGKSLTSGNQVMRVLLNVAAGTTSSRPADEESTMESRGNVRSVLIKSLAPAIRIGSALLVKGKSLTPENQVMRMLLNVVAGATSLRPDESSMESQGNERAVLIKSLAPAIRMGSAVCRSGMVFVQKIPVSGLLSQTRPEPRPRLPTDKNANSGAFSKGSRRNKEGIYHALVPWHDLLDNVQRYGTELLPSENLSGMTLIVNKKQEGDVHLQQETTINIYGVSDAQAAGKEIEVRQNDVNARIVQQLRGPS